MIIIQTLALASGSHVITSIWINCNVTYNTGIINCNVTYNTGIIFENIPLSKYYIEHSREPEIGSIQWDFAISEHLSRQIKSKGNEKLFDIAEFDCTFITFLSKFLSGVSFQFLSNFHKYTLKMTSYYVIELIASYV